MKRIEDIFYQMQSFRCIDDKGCHSLLELKLAVDKLKKLFITNQLGDKERIIYLCDNSFCVYVILFTSVITDCILVPVSNTIPLKKLISYITRLKAKTVIIGDNSFQQEEQQIVRDYANLLILKKDQWIYQPIKREIKAKCKDHIPVHLLKKDPAMILFTSGTTREPKAVILSHSRVMSMLDAVCSYMLPNKDDVFVVAKKAHHVSSWICEILLSAYVDATTSIRNQSLLLPRVCMEKVHEDHGTILFVNPFLLKKMINIDGGDEMLKYTHSVYTSGAPLDKLLHKQANERWPNTRVYNVYGLTEAGPRVLAQGPNIPIVYGSAGVPIKGVSVYFENNSGPIKRPYKIGELYVKTPYQSLGVWLSDKPMDGWFRTGDVGYFDDQGNYYIVGRNDDILCCNSHNVNPVAVEEVVTSFPGIETSIVLIDVDINGVDKLITLYTTTDDKKINENILYQYLRAHLESYECPNEFHRITNRFISATGKTQRLEAKKYYQNIIKASLYK
ncbi:MAG: acyl--CoA ligase [Clostridiales bacterium]|nr:acyl--CoA ligase [Clostridiales bacterium]